MSEFKVKSRSELMSDIQKEKERLASVDRHTAQQMIYQIGSRLIQQGSVLSNPELGFTVNVVSFGTELGSIGLAQFMDKDGHLTSLGRLVSDALEAAGYTVRTEGDQGYGKTERRFVIGVPPS